VAKCKDFSVFRSSSGAIEIAMRLANLMMIFVRFVAGELYWLLFCRQQ
jgi:hypothetical protein